MTVIKIIASVLWIISAIFWCYCFYKWYIAHKEKDKDASSMWSNFLIITALVMNIFYILM